MPTRLFLFVQLEFPWALGPPDGRYVLRSERDGEPEHVVVLGTLDAAGRPRRPTRGPGLLRRRGERRRPAAPPTPEAQVVASTRATIVDPVSLSSEAQAQAWLADFDLAHDLPAALAVLNRVLRAQRLAAADPYAHELSAAHAASIRAGWGEGEQVAEGRWLHAVELARAAQAQGSRARRLGGGGRAAALRPHERLAGLLGAHEQPLLCEELALRARLDLEQGRLAHAALELESAYGAALVELADEQRSDIPLRVSELAQLHEGVSAAARDALANAGARAEAQGPDAALDEDVLAHALGRLEAVLRARTAAGPARD